MLTKWLAEVAGRLFPKEEVRGKYGISEETRALFAEKDKLRRESRKIGEGGKHLAAMLRGWRTVVAMWKADKKLAKARREDRMKKKRGMS